MQSKQRTAGLRWLAFGAVAVGLSMAVLTLISDSSALRPTRVVSVPYGASVYIRELDLPFVLVRAEAQPDIPDGAAAYVTVTSWGRMDVSYSLENCPPALECAAAQNVVRQGVEVWDAASGINLFEVAQGAGDIRIQWEQTTTAPGGRSIDGPGGVLGFTFFPYSWLGARAGDVYFDPAESWVLGNPSNYRDVDLLTVVSHEVGHALGIDHSADRNALMWASYVGPRGLNSDDIAAVQALYGPPGNESGAVEPVPTAEAPQPTPATVPTGDGLPMTATTTVRVRSGPSTDYSQIAQLRAGDLTLAKARNAAGDWLQIEIDGQQGWVAAWLMTIQGDISALPLAEGAAGPVNPRGPQPDPGGAATATLRTSLRMRSGPGTDYDSLGLVPQGTTLAVLGRDAASNWLLVEHEGQRGWIAAWYCNIRGSLASVPVAG